MLLTLPCTAGYKFDMRVYVAATCIDPLRVYIYCDGLARFATEAYSGEKADLKWVVLFPSDKCAFVIPLRLGFGVGFKG